MPSLTSSQQGYAPAPTVEPVPVYQDPPPEQYVAPPPTEDFVPLPSAGGAAPVQQAAPPPTDDFVPLPSQQSATPPPEAEAAPVEPPKDGPTPIRELGVQTEKTKQDIGSGIQQILGGDIGGGLGSIKDAAGEQMAAQGGDLFPWRRQLTDAIAQEALDGDPAADAPWQDRLKDAVLTGTGDSDPFVRFIEEDPERTQKLMTEGYTSEGGTHTEAGTAALWEAWQDPHSGIQRAAADIFYDPSNLVSTPAGALREVGTEAGAKLLPKAVGLGARAADAATSLGLSETIPLATKGLGTGLKKIGILAPTGNQVAKDVVEQAGEDASLLTGMRRESGQINSTMKTVEKTGDTTRLTDPSGALPDVVYKTGKNAQGLPTVKGIIDDPALPDVVRPVTPADRDLILEHSRNLDYDSFGDVNKTWYREMFDAKDPVTGQRISHLETHDPDIGTPMPGRTDAWNKYRDLYAHRMQMMDSVNPGRPVLQSLLADWDSKNLHVLDIGGLTASERRLSAIEKITQQAGMMDTTAQQWFRDANSRLRTGAMDFTGDETGPGWSTLPLSRASQQALKAQVNLYPDDFYKQVTKLKGPGMKNLISIKPALNVNNSARQLAMSVTYRNFEDMMGQRFAQYGEKELPAAGEWLAKQVSGGHSDLADAIVDQLNKSGLLPRTVTTPQDAVAAINAMAIHNRAPWPQLPGGSVPTLTSGLSPKASAPPPNLYIKGSVEEAVGSSIPDEWKTHIDLEHEFGGVKKKVWQSVVEEQDNLENLRRLAQTGETRTLTAKEADTLKRGITRLNEFTEFKDLTGGELAKWTDSQVDSVAARRAQRFVEQAQGLVDSSGKAIDPGYYRGVAGRALKAYDNFAGFRRTMSLYSTTRGPAYVLMQAIGNGLTLAIAKPSALRRYSPVEASVIRKAAGDITAPLPRAVALRDGLGLGASSVIGNVSRDQVGAKTFFAKSTNPVVRGIGKIAAPQIIKEYADSFDTALRHALYSTMMEPALAAFKKELPERIEDSIMSVAKSSSTPIGIGRAQINAALDSLPDTFSNIQLREALLDASGGRTAPFYRERYTAADRAARDYLHEVRTLDKAALDEVNRVGFDFKETRADAALSRVFMFHYWMSRASVLYLNEAARNPWQAQLWARAMNSGKRKMEETGAPTWQRDLQSFLSTPAGYTGFFNPAYLLGTYLFMNDSDPASPASDLSPLGRALTDTPLIRDTMLNPLLQGAIYALGAGGSDFKPPDMLGTNKWTNDINSWLDKANLDVKTFYSENGKPKDVPNIDARELLTWATQQVNNRGWDTSFFGLEPAKPFDADKNTQQNMGYLIMDDIIAQNPDLDYTTEEGAKEVASMVEEALANPSSDLYQSALRKNVDMQMGSSGTGMAPVDFITGGARSVLPFGVTWSVDSRDAAGRRKNLDEQTALDTAMGDMIYDTPEGMAYWDSFNQMVSSGTPKSKAVNDFYKGIQQGTADVTLDGREWTAEELAALPAEDRDTLAKYWMDVTGGWKERDAQDASRDEVIKNNPDMANVNALGDYAATYPTGVRGFVEDTRRLNPNYNRFMEGLDKQLAAGELDEAEYLDKATNSVAYTAIAGIKTSRYDYDPINAGKGRVAGLAEGESLAGWKAEQGTGQSVEGSTAFAEKKDTLSKELETFTQIQQRLNQMDAYYGYPAGTTARRYASELAQGTKYISNDIYDTLKADGWSTGDINPGADGQVGWYLKWALNQMPGTDLSPDAYWSNSSATFRKKEVDRINAGIVSVDASDPGTVTDAISGIATNLPSQAVLKQETNLRAQPGGPSSMKVPPGLPVAPGQMARGSDGSTWIFITIPGFSTSGGWVPAQDLAPVA